MLIKLESRYKDIDSKLVQVEDNKYLLETNSEYVRLRRAENSTIYSIDLEGGPMICVNGAIQVSIGNITQIKKIKSIKSQYVIEFE